MNSRVLRAARISYREMFEFVQVRSVLLRALLAPLFLVPSFRFALHIAGLDRRIRRSGVVPAMAWVLRRYYGGVQQIGEPIPRHGAVLLVGNHPGLGDLPALAVTAGRADLTVVVKKRALMADMTGILSRCIVIDESLRSRADAVRAILSRLREGSAVVIYPAGEIEPDPALLPKSAEFLREWSTALDGIVTRLARENLHVPVIPVYTEGVHYAPSGIHFLLSSRGATDSFERRAAVLTLGTRLARFRRIRTVAGGPVTPAALLATPYRSPSDQLRDRFRLLHAGARRLNTESGSSRYSAPARSAELDAGVVAARRASASAAAGSSGLSG